MDLRELGSKYFCENKNAGSWFRGTFKTYLVVDIAVLAVTSVVHYIDIAMLNPMAITLRFHVKWMTAENKE